MIIKVFIHSLLASCSLSLREDDLLRVHGVEQQVARAVPSAVSDAIRAASGKLRRLQKACKEQEQEAAAKVALKEAAEKTKKETLETLESQTSALTTAARKRKAALSLLEEALAQNSSSAEAFQQAQAAWQSLDEEVLQGEAEMAEATKALQSLMQSKKQEIEALGAQLEEKKQRRDELEQTKKEKELELEKAGEVTASKQAEHEHLETAMHKSRSALEKHQLQLEAAESAVVAAMAAVSEASSQHEIVDREYKFEQQTLEMLKAAKESIQEYYGKTNELVESMHEPSALPGELKEKYEKATPAERMKMAPHLAILKEAFERYNAMVRQFHELHSFNADVYATLGHAVAEVKDNSFEAILEVCDPDNQLERAAKTSGDFGELHEACGTGLWKAVGLQRLKFPEVEGYKVEKWWDHFEAPAAS